MKLPNFFIKDERSDDNIEIYTVLKLSEQNVRLPVLAYTGITMLTF